MAPISGPCSLYFFFSLSLSPSVLLSDAGLNVACVNSARGPVIKENANSLWVARNVVH